MGVTNKLIRKELKLDKVPIIEKPKPVEYVGRGCAKDHHPSEVTKNGKPHVDIYFSQLRQRDNILQAAIDGTAEGQFSRV